MTPKKHRSNKGAGLNQAPKNYKPKPLNASNNAYYSYLALEIPHMPNLFCQFTKALHQRRFACLIVLGKQEEVPQWGDSHQ